MPRRTSPNDYQHVSTADDLSRVVRDKREDKRANKQKAKQRNRRYEARVLAHLRAFGAEE